MICAKILPDIVLGRYEQIYHVVSADIRDEYI